MTGEDSRPVPDPTVLTTDQLLRAIDSLQALLETKIDASEARAGIQIEAIDRYFQEIEARRIEQKRDVHDAVTTAMESQKALMDSQSAASKEAVTKAENATTKQLDQMMETFTSSLGSATDATNEIRSRVSRIESVRVGERQQVDSGQKQIQAVGAVLSIIVTLAAIVGIMAAAGAFK